MKINKFIAIGVFIILIIFGAWFLIQDDKREETLSSTENTPALYGDEEFDQMMSEAMPGYTFLGDEAKDDAQETAKNSCELMDTGMRPVEIFMEVAGDDDEAMESIVTIVVLGIFAYCPEHEEALDKDYDELERMYP